MGWIGLRVPTLTQQHRLPSRCVRRIQRGEGCTSVTCTGTEAREGSASERVIGPRTGPFPLEERINTEGHDHLLSIPRTRTSVTMVREESTFHPHRVVSVVVVVVVKWCRLRSTAFVKREAARKSPVAKRRSCEVSCTLLHISLLHSRIRPWTFLSNFFALST